MDKLADQLREDAIKIDIVISSELYDRIHASLQGVKQDTKQASGAGRPASFWWASSLTGVAAAIAVVAIVNLVEPEPENAVTDPQLAVFAIPQFTWKPKPALLTETLEQELANIESDLKKAERAIREDLDNIL